MGKECDGRTGEKEEEEAKEREGGEEEGEGMTKEEGGGERERRERGEDTERRLTCVANIRNDIRAPKGRPRFPFNFCW